jgi:signal transduction histidine kinase
MISSDMSDSRNNRLSGSNDPDEKPSLRLTNDQQVVDARVVGTSRRSRKRKAIDRGILDRGRNAERLVHELSNLLDGSLRNVGLALRKLDTNQPIDTQDDHVLDQLRSADHALQYMGELLKGWRRGKGQPDALVRRVDTTLGEVIHEAVKLTRPTCEAAGITLKVSVSGEAIDEPLGPLYPVIVNGLRNAVEAIVKGGHIELSADCVGDQVEIRITDTGPGVDEALARDSDGLIAAGESTKGSGRGLGLAISRDIVRAMGGVIRLENREDELTGAVLLIRLPAADTDPYEGMAR